MTEPSFLAPVVLTVACAAAALFGRSVHPATRVRLLTTFVVAAGVASAAWALVLSAGLLLRVLAPSTTSTGLAGLVVSHRGPPAFGLVAAALLIFAGAQGAAIVLRGRLASSRDGDGVVVTDDRAVIAYAHGGRRPRIVLSKGLLDLLGPAEVGVVLAHEWAHVSNRHGRYLWAARMSESFAPWLRPFTRAIRFELERWADETAAAACGDRDLVACTIAKVALAGRDRTPALSFGAHEVIRRVEAMLNPPPARIATRDALAMAGTQAVATGVASTALQLHHALPLFH